MKNKFLVLTLLLSNATLFGAQGGAPAAAVQQQVRSLQDIATSSTLQMMKDKHPDIYQNSELFEIALNNNTAIPQPVKKKLIALYEQSKEITSKAARLWVDYHATNESPLELLRRHKPELARLVDEGICPWSLSFKDIIDAGGTDRLASRIGNIFEDISGHFSNLSLTSLEGLQNIPGLAQLRWLYLNNNQLTTISSDAFNGLAQLRWLYLNNNQFTTIHSDAFNGLGQLQWLSLADNKLTTIHQGTFNSLARLQLLGLGTNQLTQEQLALIRSQVPENCQIRE